MVRKFALAFGVLVASCIGCALPKQVERTRFETLATGARKATVHVLVSDDSTGTGWYVYTDGERSLVVTAGHMCEPGMSYMVEDYNGTKTPAVVVVDSSETDDVCVLLAAHEAPQTLEIGTVDRLTYGSELWYVGFPASSIAVVKGYYAGRDERPRLAASLWGFYGASGSAVLDDTNHVVGLLVGINPNFPQESFLVPADRVQSYVAQALLTLAK